MTFKVVTIWTCDRCGRKAELEGSPRQPDEWVAVKVHRPPQAMDALHQRTLCEWCWRAVEDVLENKL